MAEGHAFFVTAAAGAIYLAGGTKELAKQNATLRLMGDGAREGFAAVSALRHKITPFASECFLCGCRRGLR